MFSLRKRFKKKKSQGVVSNGSETNNDVAKQVVMQCEDVPSAGSSGDSGRDSQSSGARSYTYSEEMGQEWRSQSFQGREAPKISIRPPRQYSVREVPSMECVYGQNPGQSSLCIQQLYESAPSVVLCTCHICLMNIGKSAAGTFDFMDFKPAVISDVIM